MGWYEDHVLPRAIDLMLGNRSMQQVRRPAMAGLSGTVLELGFGSGPNLPLYPPEVDRVLAVDPSLVGRKLAARRIAASPVPVEFVGLDGASLAMEDESVDGVLSTWTLCTIPDAVAAVREVRRVLRPGGTFHFLEHGRSQDPGIAGRQDRWNRVQQRVAGGCNLNRAIDLIVAESGLRATRLDRFVIAGPKVASAMYSGVATKE